MPGIQTPASLAALKTSIHKEFQSAFTAAPQFSGDMVTRVNSSAAIETYSWLAAIGPMEEWVSGSARTISGIKERVFQATNRRFSKVIELDRDAFEDSYQTAAGDAALRSRLLGEEAAKLPDDLILEQILNGHQRVCLDGQFYFDTDHPVNLDLSGSQSNYESTAFALTAPNFQTARARMLSFRNENGRPMAPGTDLVLHVPPALAATADGIVVALYGSSGASNVNAGKARVKVVPELGATYPGGSDTAWYLFDLSPSGVKPFALQVRTGVEFVTRDAPDSDPVFMRNAIQVGISQRMAGVYGIWQRAFKGNA